MQFSPRRKVDVCIQEKLLLVESKQLLFFPILNVEGLRDIFIKGS
jgi:hypothetical protein